MKKRSRNYARRQLTWMRKIPNLRPDRPHRPRATARSPREIVARLGNRLPPVKFEKWQALGNDYLIVEAENLPWELNAKRVELALRPAFRDRLRRGAAALRAARTPSSSPTCGSSTRTARRPSSRATARARRSSTCAATAGPTRTSFAIRTVAGPIVPTITGELTCSVDMGRASTDVEGLSLGRRGRQGAR